MPGIPTGLRNHELPLEHFDELADGRGGPETVRLLLAGEHSRRLLLLRVLLDLATGTPELLGPLPSAAAAWAALAEIEAKAPGVLHDVLLAPQVGTWLAHCLRRVRGHAPRPGPDWAEVGQVHALAVAAAVRAQLPLRTRVPVRHGNVLLPTLGLARFLSTTEYTVAEAVTADGTCRLRVGDDELEVPGADAERWWGLRRLRCMSGERVLNVSLDDIDSYRNLADPVEPGRLDEHAVRAWHRLLDAAWALLLRWHPATADALAAGLMSIAPLPDDPSWLVRSASTGDGFGGVITSLPPDPVTMAVTLVHEYQHVRLGGLLHLTALHDDGDYPENLYAPWRPDPRPLPGLVQGVYAFFGITEFWRSQRDAAVGGDRSVADFEFAYARRQTWTGLRTLAGSERLTAWGGRFVRRLTERLRPWLAETVAEEPGRAAWAAALDHRAGWRIRHVPADPSWIAQAAQAWRRGDDPPPLAPSSNEIRRGVPVWTHDRLTLYRIGAGTADHAPGADLDLIQGQPDRAIDGYLARITADRADLDAWTGLGIALAAAGGVPGWRPLLHRPELVYALHQELADAPPPPLDLVAWLATARPTAATDPCRSRPGYSATR
jgi:HEXXH motif-containing protein